MEESLLFLLLATPSPQPSPKGRGSYLQSFRTTNGNAVLTRTLASRSNPFKALNWLKN